jgi:membrane-associated phospholipid phosphatase
LPKSSAYISSDISNATIFGTAAIVGSTWIYGLRTGNEHAKETGELTLETLANAFTVYTAMQVLAGRERPYEGTGEGSFFRHHSVNTSFPGGHAMFTFAMAGIVAHEYPHPLVQILAYGAASAVAASRFTARQHFLSDVAVGSAIGYLISREIFYSRCKVGLGSACHHHTED